MDANVGREDAYCELSFSPNVALIPTVRRFVGDFYECVLGDPKIASRLVVATHELLDNAIRYSVDGQSAIRIGVGRAGGHVCVQVETRNKTTQERGNEVVRLVHEMNGARDPAGFYQKLIHQTARRTDGSGLGLGRIHAESEMDLTCELRGELLRLRAEARFASEEKAS